MESTNRGKKLSSDFMKNLAPSILVVVSLLVLCGFDFIGEDSLFLNRVVHQSGSDSNISGSSSSSPPSSTSSTSSPEKTSPSPGRSSSQQENYDIRSNGEPTNNLDVLPVPEIEKFPALVTDERGNSFQAVDIIQGVEQVFRIHLGQTTLTLPYKSIDSLVVKGVEKMNALVTVTTRDGKKLDGSVYRYLSLNVKTASDNHTLLMQDVRKIVFMKPANADGKPVTASPGENPSETPIPSSGSEETPTGQEPQSTPNTQ